MPELNLGLVGLGRIGQMHAANITSTAGIGTLSVFDLSEEQLSKAVADFGATAYDSLQELIGSGIDGLVIAAGTSAHASLIRAGVDAGIPVFCEKPLAPAAEVPELLEYIRHRNGVVQIGHQRRLDSGYLEAKRAFEAGELGWIHTLRAVTCDARPPAIEFLATSGGLFRDCSVHDFDILHWLTGREITSVFARGSNRGDPRIGEVGDVDTAMAMITFDDGTLGSVTASRYNGAGHDVRLEVQGSESTMVVGLDERSAFRSAEADIGFPTGTSHAEFMNRFEDAYLREMEAFTEVIRGVRSNPCTPEDAVAASAIADAAQQSLETGQPVAVHPVGQ
ncbi:Gfo/Idh/MocA family oxidoreductase [Arthrobacter castelli]|uniref:Gfo/Idh/MocA family oxidoreductase n=1 Tax=Arthrobacter castelli TaxID=271431 RepID=UPI000426E5B8|nr:Gfo/Idh/MocA family oxidoreductase [Arthrobacter castelli]